ncbi:MAG TPA: glycosyltransferase family 87 protein [Tepidisphaeraceae bacterium]|nr:glycosyltransferase family 87 protein [Tepidisphaeraceae bacterium]
MRKCLGIAFLIFGLIQLGFRGTQRIRHDVPLWDFVSVHAAARTWAYGGDPYDLQSVLITWHTAGIFTDRDVSYFAPVYPPTSLVMMIPLAIVPAAPAMVIWLVFTILLLTVQLMALADLAGLDRRDARLLVLIGASIASAPLQFGILSGQLSLPAISMCIIAVWCASRHREIFAGLLIGLACALKPQIGGTFFVYYLFLRRFRVAGLALLVGGLIGAIALLGMKYSQIDWMSGWSHNVAATRAIGGVNDYGWANPFRDEIIDLKIILVSSGLSDFTLRGFVVCIVLILIASYLIWFPRGISRTARNELPALACLAAISLMPVYHRVYDASLLTIAFAWALAERDGSRRRETILLLAPMCLFLIPFDIVKSLGNRLPIITESSKTDWWQSLIAPHYAWGLLATTVGLLIVMAGINRSATESLPIEINR